MVKNDMASAEAARVGEELRDARLALGVTLDDVADRLKINRRYLAAVEEGRSRDLPGPAYALGFVRTYARSLGLNADDLARRYRDGAAVPKGKDLVFPEPVPERGMPAGVIMLIGAVILVGGYAAWWSWSGSGNRVVDNVPPPPARVEQAARDAISSLSPPGADTAPVLPPTLGQAVQTGRPGVTPPAPGAAPGSPGNVLIGQPRPPAPPSAPGPSGAGTTTATAPAVPTSAPAPPATPAAPAPDASRVTLRANDEAWVQVRDSRSGQVLLNRVLRAGESFQVPGGREGLVFSTGKAQGMQVVVDGQETQALAGRTGVVRDIAVNPDALRAARPAGAAGTATSGTPAPR